MKCPTCGGPMAISPSWASYCPRDCDRIPEAMDDEESTHPFASYLAVGPTMPIVGVGPWIPSAHYVLSDPSAWRLPVDAAPNVVPWPPSPDMCPHLDVAPFEVAGVEQDHCWFCGKVFTSEDGC